MQSIKSHGWANNALMSNAHASLMVTLDVGPRIISYAAKSGTNILKNFPEQMGGSGEPAWMIRGGHRLWVAPEDPRRSYVPDNVPVQVFDQGDSHLHVGNAPDPDFRISKSMRIELAPDSPVVTIGHQVRNEGDSPVSVASWGLTVMAPGGTEIIPHPPFGPHTENLLPNRAMVLWPYVDLSDPRFTWGSRFIRVRQDASGGPTKIGLLHLPGWVAYHLDNSLFLKEIPFHRDAVYPDMNTNFQTFTNEDMLEIESLGPLRTLAPGQSTGHCERWAVFAGTPSIPDGDEALAEWITPLLKSAFPRPVTGMP